MLLTTRNNIDILLDLFGDITNNEIEIIHDPSFLSNDTLHFIIYGELFINDFMRHKDAYKFELQEIYARQTGILSVYVRVLE